VLTRPRYRLPNATSAEMPPMISRMAKRVPVQVWKSGELTSPTPLRAEDCREEAWYTARFMNHAFASGILQLAWRFGSSCWCTHRDASFRITVLLGRKEENVCELVCKNGTQQLKVRKSGCYRLSSHWSERQINSMFACQLHVRVSTPCSHVNFMSSPRSHVKTRSTKFACRHPVSHDRVSNTTTT